MMLGFTGGAGLRCPQKLLSSREQYSLALYSVPRQIDCSRDAHRQVIDKGADINVVSRLFQDFERLRGVAQRLDDFRFQCIVPSLDALRAVESVEHFRFDSGPFLILSGNRFRIFTN